MVTNVRSSKTHPQGLVVPLIKCLMVLLPSDEAIIVYQVTKWSTIPTFWFDVHEKGRRLDTKSLLIAPGSTLWFFSSAFAVPGHPKWRYYSVLQENGQQIACSCARGWYASLTRILCTHMKQFAERMQKEIIFPAHPSTHCSFRPAK